MSVLTAVPPLGSHRREWLIERNLQASASIMGYGPEDLVALFIRYIPSAIVCVLASVAIGFGIIFTKRLRLGLGYYGLLAALTPLLCWIVYFVTTSEMAITLTLLDSESAQVAERAYNSRFKALVTTPEQAIRLAADKHQPPNVRFYASCLLAEMLATEDAARVEKTLNGLESAPLIETQFIGENDLTGGFYVSGHEQPRLSVRGIVERRLSDFRNGVPRKRGQEKDVSPAH